MYYTSPYLTNFFADKERDVTTIPLEAAYLYDDADSLIHTDNGDRVYVFYNSSIFDDSELLIYTEEGYQIFTEGMPYVFDDDDAYLYNDAGSHIHEG